MSRHGVEPRGASAIILLDASRPPQVTGLQLAEKLGFGKAWGLIPAREFLHFRGMYQGTTSVGPFRPNKDLGFRGCVRTSTCKSSPEPGFPARSAGRGRACAFHYGKAHEVCQSHQVPQEIRGRAGKSIDEDPSAGGAALNRSPVPTVSLGQMDVTGYRCNRISSRQHEFASRLQV